MLSAHLFSDLNSDEVQCSESVSSVYHGDQTFMNFAD